MELIVHNDFSGGMNDTTPPDNMKDNEVRKLENAHPALRGGFEKRSGNSNVNTTSYKDGITDVNVDQVIEWIFDDGSTQLFCMINNVLYLVNQSTGVLTASSIGTLNRATIAYVIYNGMMYFCDGLNYYVYGIFDYYTNSGFNINIGAYDNVTLQQGDIVKNYPHSTHATLKGVAGHYYQANAYMASEDIRASSFGDTAIWTDVTVGAMCNIVRVVIPKAESKGVCTIQVSQTTLVLNAVPGTSSLSAGMVIDIVDSKSRTPVAINRTIVSVDTGNNTISISGVAVTTANGDIIISAESKNSLNNIKRCKYLAFHPLSFRIFAGGNDLDPTAIYYSEYGAPTEFIETSVVFPTTANGPVTGLVAFNRSMLIAYKNTWRVWRGIAVGVDAEWKSLNIPYGCVSNDTIVLTPESLTFQANDGHLYIMSPSILADDNNVTNMGQSLIFPITEERLSVTVGSMVTLTQNKATWHDGKYLLSYCDDLTLGAKNNKVLEITWATKAFSIVSGWQVNCWCSRVDTSLLFGSLNYILDAYTGYNDFNVLTGIEKAVSMDVQTKPYSLNTYFNKMLKFLTVTANQYVIATDIGALTIEVTADYVLKEIDAELYATTDLAIISEINTDLNESLVWVRSWGKLWGFSEIINKWVVMNRTGYRFIVSFKDESLTNPTFIYGVGFMFDVLKDFNSDPISQTPLISQSV